MSIQLGKLTFILALLFSTASVANVTVIFEQYEPYSYTVNGRATGSHIDDFKTIIEHASVNAHFEVYPWARALTSVKRSPDTLLFPVIRTTERETELTWVEALSTYCPGLIKLTQNNHIQILQTDQIKNYNMAMVRQEFINDAILDAALIKPENVIWVADSEAAIQLLVKQKVDLIVGDLYDIALMAQSLNYAPSSLKQAFLLDPFKKELYLVANPDTSPSIIRKLKASIPVLKSETAPMHIFRPGGACSRSANG